MRSILLGLTALTLSVHPAFAASDAEVAACVERNVPGPDDVRAVRITRSDPRASSKRIIILRMFGRKTPAGGRDLLVRFSAPEDVRGASLLILDRGGANEVYMASPAFPEAKRVTSANRGAALFETDISYEDLEWLEGLRHPDISDRKADAKEGLREVYVVEATPEDSAYGRVVSYVDKETCLPIRTEFFDKTGRIRKEMTSDPRSHIEHEGRWAAHEIMIRDVRDLTSTHLMVDTHQQDVLLADELFTPEGLERTVSEDPDVRIGAQP
jgi:hypothetical protein